MSEPRIALAKDGVFRTTQGEGALLGTDMIFIRLAGCSVGCPACDTDYAVHERVTVDEVADRASRLKWGAVEWVWITGGEPSDHNLSPLIRALRSCRLRVAVATAGTREVRCGSAHGGVDFLSVSPHVADERWVQRSGTQLNLVPGLNGLSLRDPGLLAALKDCEANFGTRYVTPMMDAQGKMVNLQECLDFVRCRRGYRLGVQAHRFWGVP